MADTSQNWGELLQIVRQRESGEPLDEPGRQAALALATSLGRASLPDTVGCSISLQTPDGEFITPAAAGTIALDLDGVQYATDDGPCLSAARNQRPERVDAMADDERWPELTRAAERSGVHSSLSMPLLMAGTPAALNLYARVQGCYRSERARALAGVLARATSALLATAEAAPVEGLSVARVQRTIAERSLIAQAQGVVMARDGLSARLAYRKLAVRSGLRPSALRDVAREVLDAEEAAAGQDQDVSA
jgi:ANTAR domain/GAF domain